MTCFFCSLLFHFSYLFFVYNWPQMSESMLPLECLNAFSFYCYCCFIFDSLYWLLFDRWFSKVLVLMKLVVFVFFSMTMRWCLWMYVLFWISLLCETACLLKRGHFTVYSRLKCMHLVRVDLDEANNLSLHRTLCHW